MKKLIPAFILMFSFCFMFFIYEPLTMYATNINDFWFDLGIMIKPVFLIFACTFLVGSLLWAILYFLNHKFSKEVKCYHILLLLFAICFFATYIQGNYLIKNLPALDGSTIVWTGYGKENWITGIIWLILLTISIVMVKKVKLEKTVKIVSYVSLAVVLMLTTSLITTLTSNNAFINKEAYYITEENINTFSQNENFLIFMLDAVDEDTFYKVWQENEEFQNLFDDFTYYRDAMSTYAFTRDSVPFILTGLWNKNENDFGTYSSNAYNNSLFFTQLKNRNYAINLYDEELIWNGEHNFEMKNVTSSKNANIKLLKFFKQEMKYDLFKYLPYGLKKYSRIEHMHFGSTIEKFNWNDDLIYTNLKNDKVKKVEEKQFQFIHAEGAHVPFDYDKNMNKIENGTYEQKIAASLTLIKTYLDRLKENNLYDNSVIIIMADHGYSGNTIMGRFNPLLMMKGKNEKHDTIINDVKVSYEDLQGAFTNLLNGQKSTDLFQNIDKNRERTFIWYAYGEEDHMVEYITTDNSKNEKKFRETGNVYDR